MIMSDFTTFIKFTMSNYVHMLSFTSSNNFHELDCSFHVFLLDIHFVCNESRLVMYILENSAYKAPLFVLMVYWILCMVFQMGDLPHIFLNSILVALLLLVLVNNLTPDMVRS